MSKNIIISVVVITMLVSLLTSVSVFAQEPSTAGDSDSGGIIKPVDMGATTILEGKSAGKIEVFQQKLDLENPRIEIKPFERG